METLVLPTQDQLARHRDGRSRRVAGMLYSPKFYQGNACGSASHLGPQGSMAHDVTGNGHVCDGGELVHVADRRLEEKASLLEKSSSLRYQNAHVRYSSVPKGYGRHSEGSYRQVSNSEEDLDDGLHVTLFPGKKHTSPLSGQVMQRYSAKGMAVKSHNGGQKLETISPEGPVKAAESKRLSRRSSLDSVATDSKRAAKIAEQVFPLTILQRPKKQDEALANLAKVLEGEGPLAVKLSPNSSLVCPTVSGRETAKCLHDDSGCLISSHEDGLASLKTSKGKLKKHFRHTSLKSTVDSDLFIKNLDSATDGLKSTQSKYKVKESGYVAYSKNLVIVASVAACSDSISIPVKQSWQEDFLLSSSPPLNERWAGPAFSNSPPPSSLPLPKFSMRQLRTASLEIPIKKTGISDEGAVPGSLSAPGTPLRRFLSVPSEASQAAGFLGSCLDVANATKDLRRILNLDPTV